MPDGIAGRRIPTAIQNRLGSGKLEKGNWPNNIDDDNVYLIAWDFAHECNGPDCPVFDICEYKKYWQMKQEDLGKPGVTNKCMLQQRYMKHVIHAVMEHLNTGKMNQKDILKMGYHILPLYSQLFKFKLWEYGNSELVYISEKGTPKVHPVYKEIREIIKTITMIWKDMSGDARNPRKADMDKIGDSSFIDAMHEGFEDTNEETDEVSTDGVGIDFENDEKPKKTKNRRRKKK